MRKEKKRKSLTIADRKRKQHERRLKDSEHVVVLPCAETKKKRINMYEPCRTELGVENEPHVPKKTTGLDILLDD